MSNRSWFFASRGQQQGPYPEAQFREFIARGTVSADTLVWCEGMADWAEGGRYSGPFVRGLRPVGGALFGRAAGRRGGFGWRIAFDRFRNLGVCLALAGVLHWRHPCHPAALGPRDVLQVDRFLHVRSGAARSRLYGPAGHHPLVVFRSDCPFHLLQPDRRPLSDALSVLIQLGLYWLAIKWFVANLASNGQPLGLSFSGSFWGYLGWNILAALSMITIIGWAWV